MTVFVRWYGNVLEGETDGTIGLFGMVEVKIPIQGMHATALFSPQHVYSRQEDVPGNSPNSPIISRTEQNNSQKQNEISRTEQNIFPEWQRLQQFKAEHWDQERGHLCIDALDEFYRLWREGMAKRLGMMQQKNTVAAMAMEHPSTPAEALAPMRIVSDKRMEELRTELQTAFAPSRTVAIIGSTSQVAPKHKKPSKPIKAIQLSLFD